ncbi:16S rRNA (uracil(1498)-N(3))-methyltransferase [Apibacter sp. HY039]|uniref:RsmE family RNA methyltransferase n=1 Tax=Apibacter sp. HY039 TaxID=2501476 RepID=UPI000FEC0602|nr:RsmE family RNA methyltransferase [Apibacter sp. HY039]
MKLFIGSIFKDNVEIREDEAHHIVKVLRMSSGEEIYVTDGAGKLAKGTLMISGKKTEVEIIEIYPDTEKSKTNLHIAIAPTKNIDRFEFFLEKAVELGVTEITPLLCANSERKTLKLERLEKQLESACKQSLQRFFPILNPLTAFKDFVHTESKGKIWVAHCYKEYEKSPIHEVLGISDAITFMIGPEGDFSKKEISDLYESGVGGVSLGENRLRTETAGIFIAGAHYYSQISKTQT